MSDRMGDIRNEDYVKLMGFYANPERYTKTYQPNADGKQRASKTVFKENYKDVKKSLDRFEEAYGGYDIKEEGKKQLAKFKESQDFSKGGQLGYAYDLLANNGAGSYAKGTNPFFEAFESYDPRANMRDDIKGLQSQMEEMQKEPAADTGDDIREEYKPSKKFSEAKSRAQAYMQQSDNIGNQMFGSSTSASNGYDGMQEAKEAEMEAQGTTNGTDYGFDVMEADPDGPERRQIVFS